MHAERDIVTANPSVCLSVTLWCRIETDAHIVRHFPPSGSGVTTFWAQPPLQNYKENSLSGCVKHMGVWKFAIFDRNCVSGNGTRQVHGYYGLLIGSHSHRLLIVRFQFQWPWMTLKCRIVWPRMTAIGMLTEVGRSMFLEGHHAPHPKVSPRVPKKFWPPANARLA